MTTHDLWLMSPEISVAALAEILVVADLFVRDKVLLIWLAVLGLIVPVVFALILWFDTPSPEVGVFGTVTADRMALFFHFLLLGTTAAVIVAGAT